MYGAIKQTECKHVIPEYSQDQILKNADDKGSSFLRCMGEVSKRTIVLGTLVLLSGAVGTVLLLESMSPSTLSLTVPEGVSDTTKTSLDAQDEGENIGEDLKKEYMLVDSNATFLTKKLHKALYDMGKEDGIMFGHQMTNWNGQEWTHPKDDEKYDSSDVNEGTGDWPVMFGYDMLYLTNGESFDGHAKWAFENGGIINFYWEAKNPYNNADAYNCAKSPITRIMPGGKSNKQWTKWLDMIADFAKGLVVDGHHVPIVFRLFHENTGSWFWWGTKCATPEQFTGAWKYTVSYLRDTRQVHNILYAYAPGKPAVYTDAYESLYPGNEWVDIISPDRYGSNSSYLSGVKDDCEATYKFANKNKKIMALGETGVIGGVQDVTNPMWFKEQMLEPMASNKYCKHLSYALTYTNYKEKEYWVPLPGQTTYPGFLDMYTSTKSIFLGDNRWQSTDYYQAANGTCCDATIVKSTSSNKAKYWPMGPSSAPALKPTHHPTTEPTSMPSSSVPSIQPTSNPSSEPTSEPTFEPTNEPTSEPTNEPTSEPSMEPTGEPTKEVSTDSAIGTHHNHTHHLHGSKRTHSTHDGNNINETALDE